MRYFRAVLGAMKEQNMKIAHASISERELTTIRVLDISLAVKPSPRSHPLETNVKEEWRIKIFHGLLAHFRVDVYE